MDVRVAYALDGSCLAQIANYALTKILGSSQPHLLAEEIWIQIVSNLLTTAISLCVPLVGEITVRLCFFLFVYSWSLY